MKRLGRTQMGSVIGGNKPAICLDLDGVLWGAIVIGQPEIALLVWGIMVGKGCFAAG